jgi:hypothetical protein
MELSPKSKKYLENNDFTIIITFSRQNMVSPFFDAFEKLVLPRSKINLVIYDNTENSLLYELLLNKLNNMPFNKKGGFKSIILHKSYRKGGSTLLGMENKNFYKSKLNPIWEMWRDMQKYIKTELFMVLEDDTIVPKNAFIILLNDFFSLPNCGFVTGIETGRVPFSYQKVGLGVHLMIRKNNKILQTINLDPNSKGIKKIDCSGVYCFITRKDLYKKAFDLLDKEVAKAPFFGMDLLLVNNIQRMGYNLYADFRVWCDHLQQSGAGLRAFNKTQAVKMGSIWIPEFKNYAHGIRINDAKRTKI